MSDETFHDKIIVRFVTTKILATQFFKFQAYGKIYTFAKWYSYGDTEATTLFIKWFGIDLRIVIIIICINPLTIALLFKTNFSSHLCY